MLGGTHPNRDVSGGLEPDIPYMLGTGIFLLQGCDNSMREILIEKQFHDGGIATSFRSLSAAKTRTYLKIA